LPKLQQAPHLQQLNSIKDIFILGIESSCDDTSAAVIKNDKILANVTAGQDVHKFYGGVVPELASRAHQQHIVPVVHKAILQAGLSLDRLDGVAYTQGPGLLGSLLVGSSFAKSMGLALGIPVFPIHHMKAHVLAHFIEDAGESKPPFPFICLTVSGGHTQLLKVKSPSEFEILGETTDDAAGEAFDKAAKILGLPYPGGPEIDRLAAMGDPKAFSFSKPKVPGLNFSFSGLKTGFRNFVEKNQRADPEFITMHLNDLCASIQATIIEMLMEQLVRAASETGITHIALAGGVSANSGLRAALQTEAAIRGWRAHIPPIGYCTDNGAMIAMAGYFAFLENNEGRSSDAAKARWSIDAE
jgi:N6-L-threonylcarbamoyladenine synthase